MPPQSSNSILPSSEAIHTTTSETQRTFYYSSLTIDHGGTARKSRWKVHLGDIVAVAKNDPNRSTFDLIQSWKPNHYVKKSLDWKVGLVVAIRKVITRRRQTDGSADGGRKSGISGSSGPMFECHVQWLDKALDLDANEMKTSKLKNFYRPYNTKSKEVGSQLPHVLINRPGDYAVVSMLPMSDSDEQYSVLLPVRIQMKTNRDFMKNGIKEKEESKNELQFCCTKTRRQSLQRQNSSDTVDVNTFLNERDPDAWVHLNCPYVNVKSGNSNENIHNPPFVDNIPEPLQQAWDGWLQSGNQIDSNTGSNAMPKSISEDTNAIEHKISLLRDALVRGWIQSRRERYDKAADRHEEQQRKINDERTSSIGRATTSKQPGGVNAPENAAVPIPETAVDNSIMRRESIAKKRKRKELRFSADTKQPPSNEDLVKRTNKSKAPSHLRVSSTAKMTRFGTGNDSPTMESMAPDRESKRKKGRHVKVQGSKDDEVASTTTRDTHSTDTTIPTRGAGSKRKKTTSKAESSNTSDTDLSVTISDSLNKWRVDPAMTKDIIPFHATKRREHFRNLRMVISSSVFCSLLDEDPRGSKNTSPKTKHSKHVDQSFHITNIFREKSDDSDDSWRFTIKWFYRLPELKLERRTKNLKSMNKTDGLVETFDSCDCSAKELLPAFVELTSDKTFRSFRRQGDGDNPVPVIRMLCQHLERSQGNITMQSDWNFEYSNFLERLPACTQNTLPGPFMRALQKMPTSLKKKYNEWFVKGDRRRDVESQTRQKQCGKIISLDIVPGKNEVLFEHSGNNFFDEVHLNVRKTDLHSRLRSKSTDRWTLAIGYVVAIHCKTATLSKVRGDSWYPFEKKWCPGQIVGLYKKECGTWMMEIRWFDRYEEILQHHKSSHKKLNMPHALFETEVFEHLPVSDALPGRIILSSVVGNERWDVIINGATGLPLIPRLCTHICVGKEIKPSMEWTDYDFSLHKIPPGLTRGLLLRPRNRQNKERLSVLSRSYTKAIKRRGRDKDCGVLRNWSKEGDPLVEQKLNDPRFNDMESVVLEENEHKPGEYQDEKTILRIDALHLRVFYSEITLLPEYKVLYGAGKYQPNTASTTITAGDTIRARVPGSKRYPYDCNWGVGEVVSIFKEFSSQDEFDQEKNMHPNGNSQHNLMIEIRWFYERNDISMTTSSTVDTSGIIEVFETDDCRVMEAMDTVLNHVKLVEDSSQVKKGDLDHFLCTRFWSTKRRSLIPCSGLNGRMNRCLMYSKLGAEHGRTTELSPSKLSSIAVKPANWKDSMASLISALTLKDASKHAYESREALVGREKELSRLLAFFKAGLTADHNSEGYKSSLFIGGPPGVGKTASVRAAIARLQSDQKTEGIPPFRFISLNGIEVRHPNDIYIRFWEVLTGRNHVGSYERAREWLEAYFTSTSCELGIPNSSPTIVLLDEIDYLVTSDQSVLYNLFDWPKRAAGISGNRRLVVVAISNTLNLVDKLMPSVQSRAGTERFGFQAYSLHDTTAILTSKIKEGSANFKFFEDDAILFVAKKTAALSGDIRKALQICRSAAELVTQRFQETEGTRGSEILSYPKIRISDVQKASLESFNMAMVTAVSFSTSFEALLLVSLAALRRSTGREVGGFDVKDVQTKMEALAYASGESQYIPPPSFGETLRLLTKLGEMNLIELQTLKSSSRIFRQSHGGSGGAWPMTSLAIDDLTLFKGFKNTSHKEFINKNLPTIF